MEICGSSHFNPYTFSPFFNSYIGPLSASPASGSTTLQPIRLSASFSKLCRQSSILTTPLSPFPHDKYGWPGFESADGGKRSGHSQGKPEWTNSSSRHSSAGKSYWGYLASYPGSTLDVCDETRGVHRLQLLLPQPVRRQPYRTASRG